MSVYIMSAVWDLPLAASDKLVLLSLADHADDRGRCYPSVKRLRERTGLSERGVQTVVKRLVEAGLLHVDANAGQGGANLYTITPPAPDAPPHQMRPRTRCAKPPQEVHPNRQEPSSVSGEARARVPSFEDFWAEWPDQRNKPRAEKAWKKLNPEHRREAHRLCAEWFASWQAANPDLSPIHASTFLNNRRWEDAPPVPRPARSQSRPQQSGARHDRHPQSSGFLADFTGQSFTGQG